MYCLRKRSVIAAAIILAVSVFAQAEEYPFIGIVTGSGVNVRVKPGLEGEVIGKVTKDDAVTVVSGIGEWYAIKLPANAALWMHSITLNGATVKKQGANVRAAPSVQATTVTVLPEGTEVTLVGSRDEWVKIRPPENTTGYIYARYVRYYSSEAGFTEKQAQEKLAGKEFSEAVSFMEKNMVSNDITSIPYDAMLERFRNVIFLFPNTGPAVDAERRIDDLIEKQKTAQRIIEEKEREQIVIDRYNLMKQVQHFGKEIIKHKGKDKETEMRGLLFAYNTLRNKYPHSRELVIADRVMEKARPFITLDKAAISTIDTQTLKENTEPELFEFHGRIEELGVFMHRPGTHKMVKGRLLFKKTLCYLKSDTFNLDRYVGQERTVTGSMEFVPGFDNPVVTVAEIR